MVYLDNAATTYPKPRNVYAVWSHAITAYGANPGRAGHALAQATGEAVFLSRSRCGEFFGAEPENTVFTLNCTHALNTAIKGLAHDGAHYVLSDIEHNAVIRPVHALTSEGADYTLFETSPDAEQTVWNAERAIRPQTVALVCTAAGNVTGQRLPVKELADLCRRKRICFICDAAQGAGVLPLDLRDGINIICAAGHKGLYGPMGTGLMRGAPPDTGRPRLLGHRRNTGAVRPGSVVQYKGRSLHRGGGSTQPSWVLYAGRASLRAPRPPQARHSGLRHREVLALGVHHPGGRRKAGVVAEESAMAVIIKGQWGAALFICAPFDT